MPRAKEFDPDEVLEQAMDLFWEQGYEATSAQDLVDHLGIGRSSLYSTFGSKRDLYLQALDRYRQRGADELRQARQDEDSAKATLQRVFTATVEAMTESQRGCFVANATAERAACDDAVGKRVDESLEHLQETFADLVRQGQEQGTIPADRDATAVGRFLAVVQYGLRVTARTGPSEEALRDAVTVALSVLE
jgi:TetR/AcrR family transcriptional repressor of nem operon